MIESITLIAVVDDEESVRRALQRLIRSAGMNVNTYASGAEFFASAQKCRPDCLVLDLHMPLMNGFEVQSQLVQSELRVPIIVLTGHDTPEARERAMEAGAAAYFRKPVDGQALLDAIASAIGPMNSR